MKTKVTALFDPNRRREVQNAIRRGEAPFKKPRRRGLKDDVWEPDDRDIIGPLPELRPVYLKTNPPTFQIGTRIYSADEYLVLAIQDDDLKAVKDAVSKGADVNHSIFFLPPSPNLTVKCPTLSGDPTARNPLQLARKLGYSEIAGFLIAMGARE